MSLHPSVAAFAGAIAFAFATACLAQSGQPPTAIPAAAARSPEETATLPAVDAELRHVLTGFRKIVVLFADQPVADAETELRLRTVGHAIFHEKLERESKLAERFAALVNSGADGYRQELENALDYIESGRGMFDADRLAFQEVLLGMQRAVASDSSLPAIKLHKRIGEDLEALGEIERLYDREITQIFSRLETRSIVLRREKWEDYVAHLKTLYQRDQILKDYGVIEAYPASALPPDEELFGDKLPPKTIALTFDDGPHGKFTDEIVAILRQYDVPAAFFQVGNNIGAVEADGAIKMKKGAAISRKLIGDGYAVGNHSYSHAQLTKLSGDSLKSEIATTDTLLKAADPKRTPIFRFPYGARNDEGLRLVGAASLRSIMWNIDSMDWADPVPRSIADRVLREVDGKGRGIVLFHDIHERTVKALPMILDRLVADGYRFAAWDGDGFSAKEVAPTGEKRAVTTGYANSWAVVIGINDYEKWPRLQYAVNDARAMRETLIGQFGFAPERIFTLQNGQATRRQIMAVFNEELTRGNIQKNDRIFVFFAGHGATRKLGSGRDIGYIVPVDAGIDSLATDAIPMTEIQNIAENLPAKHVFFVMDACYSGLGLARGSNGNFLRENARRTGRQMLTAGGADQTVADGGPDGHSIFSWTLLQALNGKADMNGDSLITATELAAYVAPAVSGVSLQTPAFGSLPGSQGGEFVFELAAKTEFLSEETSQLSGAAIALNNKLEATAASPTEPGKPVATPVKVKDLQGREQTLKLQPAIELSARQLAQQANDRGLQFYKEKRYAESEAEFTEALKMRPDFALAANNLGFVYFKQGQYREAARWFEKTLAMDPSRAIAYLNLGDAYAGIGEKERAGKAFRTYLELAPTGVGAQHARDILDTWKNAPQS